MGWVSQRARRCVGGGGERGSAGGWMRALGGRPAEGAAGAAAGSRAASAKGRGLRGRATVPLALRPHSLSRSPPRLLSSRPDAPPLGRRAARARSRRRRLRWGPQPLRHPTARPPAQPQRPPASPRHGCSRPGGGGSPPRLGEWRASESRECPVVSPAPTAACGCGHARRTRSAAHSAAVGGCSAAAFASVEALMVESPRVTHTCSDGGY